MVQCVYIGCRNDDMIQLGPLYSQAQFQFVQISDVIFVIFSCISPHIINWIQIWRILGSQFRLDKFWSFFL